MSASSYASNLSLPISSTSSLPLSWERARRETRRLEGEVDSKLAAMLRLVQRLDGCLETVRSVRSPDWDSLEDGRRQTNAIDGDSNEIETVLATAEATEMETQQLLNRLSQCNDEIAECVQKGVIDAQVQAQKRHLDVLRDYKKEFQRLSNKIGEGRQRLRLFSGRGLNSNTGSGNALTSGMLDLHREKVSVGHSARLADEIIATATSTRSTLLQQRQQLGGVGGKLGRLIGTIPNVNTLMTTISRKQVRDKMIVAFTMALCLSFIIIYFLNL